MKAKLLKIYDSLYKHFGPQYWWPGETQWEICLGAILTQNTNWNNVEKAIINLKHIKLIRKQATPKDLSINLPENFLKTNDIIIEEAIRPSGYYRRKTKKLKCFAEWWLKNVKNNSLTHKGDLKYWRESLLSVNGIGPETADSILLYAFNFPTFVIDAYTKRIMSRHAGTSLEINYNDLRNLFLKNLEPDVKFFNEYHALIVKLAKEECLKSKCLETCILRQI
jgi:endonuclease-3 related protein